MTNPGQPQHPYGQNLYGQNYGQIPQQGWPAPPQNAGAPLSPAPPRGTQIHEFAAPRVPLGPILAVLVGLIVVALVFAGFFLSKPKDAPATTAQPTASAAANETGMPFTMPADESSSGTWQIINREWTTTGVSVHIRIVAKTGRVTYGFLAFANAGTTSVYPTTGERSPELRTGALNEGEVADGYIFLALDKGTATLILTTSMGRQISALPISS